MTPDKRAELKQLCGNEPNLRATLAALETDLAPKQVDVEALLKRRDELLAELKAIDQAKAEIAEGCKAQPAAEPEPQAPAVEVSESKADEAPVKKPHKHK